MLEKLQLLWPRPPRQAQHSPQEQLSTPIAEPNQPHVGRVLVNITPVEHETAFWESGVFQVAAAEVDSWSFVERGCSLLLILRLCACDLPVEAIGFPRRNLLNCQLIGILHVVLKAVAPSLYAHCRWLLCIHYRFYTFLITVAIADHARAKLMEGPTISATLQASLLKHAAPQHLTTLTTFHLILAGSASLAACIRSLSPILPFPYQLLLQALTLVLLVSRISIPATHTFSHPTLAHTSLQLCRSLTAAPHTLQHTLAPFLPPLRLPHPSLCGAQSPFLLVLFTQLFIGFILPTYFAYFYERSLKLLFLQTLPARQHLPATATPSPAPATSTPLSATQPTTVDPSTLSLLATTSRPHPPPAIQGAPPLPQPPSVALHCTSPRPPLLGPSLHTVTRHTLCLCLLALLSWQLALALHAPLAKILDPLPFPGSYSTWYWELTCGTDGPCCPA